MKHRALLLIATVLACDTGTGVERAAPSAVQDAVAAGVSRHHDEVLAELSTKLGLSADQSARVREMLARHHAESEAARAQGHANHQRTMQELTTEIEAVLDSTQVQRLHAWLAEHHGPASPHAPAHGH